MNSIKEFLAHVRRADFEEIETVRDQVTFSDLGSLSVAYWDLATWDQKAALIHLIQDHEDPRFQSLMLDFLKAPDSLRDDNIILTKAIALCYLDGNDDDFMRYYNDTRLIQTRANEILRVASEPQRIHHLLEEPANAITHKTRSGLKVFALTTILVGLALLGYRAINIRTLNEYRDMGISTEARVTDKWEKSGVLCLGISYFVKDLQGNSELYLTELCEFIPKPVWESLQVDSRVWVRYLPKDPAENTILAASLENENRELINRLPIGGIILGLGFAALAGYIALTCID